MRVNRYVTALAVLGAAALFVASCDRDPVGVDAYSTTPCRLPELPASFARVGAQPDAVAAALADAASRASAALESRPHTDELVGALDHLAANLHRGRVDANCRMLILAVDALAEQNAAAELPDRAVIELALHLGNTVLRAE